MRSSATKILLAVAIALLPACGDSNGAPACGPPLDGSCTKRSGFMCTEYAGLGQGLPPVMNACTRETSDGPDIWSAMGCSHANALGACRKMQAGVCVAVWLYGPVAASAEAQTMCAQQGGTWVAP